MLAVRGKLSDTLRVSVEKTVKEIRTSSPGAYAVSLQETVYFPELFQVMGNEGEYLLGDVKTPPPEPETESGTAEEGEETESEPEEEETEEESEETSEEEKTGDGEEESSGTGSAGTEKPVEVIEPTIPAEPEESESEVPKDGEEDPFA